jgi:hypothetical protein
MPRILKIRRILAAMLLVHVATVGTKCPAQPLSLSPHQTVLLLPAHPDSNENDAATLLQTWLRKASGVSTGFTIKNELAIFRPASQVVIALGNATAHPDPRLAQLSDDGFLIHRTGQEISIAGRLSSGTFYGAVSFLDRYAGVRFYMPTATWTSLPADPHLVFDGGDVLSQPFVISGFFSGVKTTNLGDDDWLHRIGGTRRKGGTHQHDLYAIFPPEKFAATHPEIYPIYNGQRYIPKNSTDQAWQINFAEPATLAAAEDSIRDYFQKNPHDLYIAVSVNDSERWSQDARNQAILDVDQAKDPQGDYALAASSETYWHFMNQLAAWMQQAVPGKLLIGLAYGPTNRPPPFPLADNIVVFTNLHLSELPWYTTPANGQPAILDAWLALAHHFGNDEWYEGDGFLLPRIYSGYWSDFLRDLTPRMTSAFMHCEAYPNWGFDGPKYYIAARMFWDPQTDPQALTRQFCDDMFGPAAQDMDDYFNELEDLWKQLDIVEGPRRKLGAWAVQLKTAPGSRAIIARCHDSLAAAAAAATTPAQQARIALFAKCFAFSESLFALDAAPTDAALHDHALALAQDLAKDPWAVYNPQTPIQAVEAIYQKPKPAAPKSN